MHGLVWFGVVHVVCMGMQQGQDKKLGHGSSTNAPLPSHAMLPPEITNTNKNKNTNTNTIEGDEITIYCDHIVIIYCNIYFQKKKKKYIFNPLKQQCILLHAVQ